MVLSVRALSTMVSPTHKDEMAAQESRRMRRPKCFARAMYGALIFILLAAQFVHTQADEAPTPTPTPVGHPSPTPTPTPPPTPVGHPIPAPPPTTTTTTSAALFPIWTAFENARAYGSNGGLKSTGGE